MKINSPYNVILPGMSFTQINSYRGKPSAYISELKQSVMTSSNQIAQINHHVKNLDQGKEFVKNAVKAVGPQDGKIIDAWA